MIHTIIVNNKNTSEHIIHLDQHIPLNIKPLPENVAYQIQDTSILTTTTRTLQDNTIQQLRQKNKNILEKTILIIIQNTKTIPHTKIQTIQENPQIKTYTTTTRQLPQILKQIIQTQTPPTQSTITINKNTDNTYTLQQDNTPIKTYKSLEYIKLIQETLIQNPNMTLQQAEYQAQRQYYKHISYDKTNQTYKLTLKQKTISNHKKLTHALQERNIQQQKEKDEETLCHFHNTTTNPLPSTPWNNPLHNMKKDHKKYLTQHQTYHNNPDTTTHIHQNNTPRQTILNTQKPDRNIKKHKNTYTITRTQNKKTKTYHITKDKNQARYIRDQLEQNNYNKEDITLYQIQYHYNKKEYRQTYNNKNKIIDYYQKTKTKLTTKKNIKDEYQISQIQQKNQNTKKNII